MSDYEYFFGEDYLDFGINRYEACILASKRARALLNGAPALLDKRKAKFTAVAMDELRKKKLNIIHGEDD